MEQLLSQVTWWHWLVLALILFGVEMMTGTFDLLMAAIAAGMTALYAAFAPDGISDWHWQFVMFTVSAITLILLIRFAFPNLRKVAPQHPTLNRRMASLVGQSGEVTRDLAGGQGQVKIGDTVWGAEAAAGEGPIGVGEAVVVESTRSNMAVVRKA